MGVLIFLALVGAPIVEIAVFIEVGGRIGLWYTLGLILLTAVVGTALLRIQGLAVLARARETLDSGGLPVQEVLDGVCLLLAGALLLTPGFVTDALGGVLLVPPARRLIQRWVLARLKASGRFRAGTTRRGPGGRRSTVIEGEFTVEDGNGEEGERRDEEEDDRLPPPRGDRRRKP